MKAKLLAGLISALCLTGAVQAQSNDWPNQKVIKLISVFPPGGSVDQVARILAPTLQNQMKQSVIVENIGGASGVIGTAALAKAAPDGYTFAVVFDTHGVNPSLKEKMPFDTKKDLITVTMIGTAPMVIAASKNSGITSFKQLLDESKAKKPNSYGSIGTGSLGHLALASLSKDAKFDWTHVPYRGGGPLMQDALAGHVPLSVGSIFLVKPHADSGGVIPLAVTTRKRSPEMPNVPTIAESGYPNFEAPAWWAVIAPANTPSAIVNKMHDEIAKALKTPDVANRLKAQGIDVQALGPKPAQDFVNKQIDIWGKFVKDNNIKETN
jgi:tripartite-type tricarboxylate transporter receptor subunit TctC